MSKVALITGASRGIGRAIALKFASEGYNIAINYIGNQDEALEVQKECCAHGIEAMIYEGDVTDYDAMDQMMKAVLEQFGSIDVLVNNSGITKDQLLLKMNTQSFMDVIDVNLKGSIACCREFVKHAMDRGGKIVLIGSFVANYGCACESVYSASKAGIVGFCKALANELGNFNFNVNIVNPGFIDTKINNNLSSAEKEDIEDMTPLMRLGQARDVAEAVAFLSEDSGNFITGQLLNVDGGYIPL